MTFLFLVYLHYIHNLFIILHTSYSFRNAINNVQFILLYYLYFSLLKINNILYSFLRRLLKIWIYSLPPECSGKFDVVENNQLHK